VITFTGERVIPEIAECGPNTKIFVEHKARYEFASTLLNSRMKVLDIACGVGYGSKLLAMTAGRVVGCDIDGESIEYANTNYGSANIDYQLGNATKLHLPSDSFDALISFETLEHIRQYNQVLSEFQRVLKPGGLLVISSPNRNTSMNDNKFHHKEFTKKELEEELATAFTDLQFYCQLVSAEDITFRLLKKSKILFGAYQRKKGKVLNYSNIDDSQVQNIIVVCRRK
jgi:ubiquinone/menaquinone biosynthesis C-methylase UbiE